MGGKLTTPLTVISLPDGWKQSENGYLNLLLHFIHEHTIDDLREQSIQDRRQFKDRFLSPHKIRRQEYCSTFLRCLVENSAEKTQLEILTQIEKLRSEIENAYRENSQSQVDSVEDSLRELVLLTTHESWIDPESRKCSAKSFDAFEQFGGLYVFLDLLLLDHRLRNLESKFLALPFREIVLWFIGRLINHRDDVKAMFLKSVPLLTLLGDNYGLHIDDIHGLLTRKLIAQMFQSLCEFKGVLVGVDYVGIVTSLTETAVSSHTGSDELISSLEAISSLVRRSSGCRVDFLAVDGSIDMLIDLYSDRKEYLWPHPDSRHHFRYFLLIWLINIWFCTSCTVWPSYANFVNKVLISLLGLIIAICHSIPIIYYILLEIEPDNVNRKCELASKILINIAGDLHTNERALERFRQRDACRLLALYIHSQEHYRKRYSTAIRVLSRMISGHRRRRMGDIEVEKRILRELNVEQTIRADLNKHWYSDTSKRHFNNIFQFLES